MTSTWAGLFAGPLFMTVFLGLPASAEAPQAVVAEAGITLATNVPFDEVCAFNTYAASSSGETLGLSSSPLNHHGPFSGHDMVAAFGSTACLVGDPTRCERGWLKATSREPITGVSVTDQHGDIRLRSGRTFRISFSANPRLEEIPSGGGECARTTFSVGAICDFRIRDGLARGEDDAQFAYSTPFNHRKLRRPVIDGCARSRTCRTWPRREHLAFAPSLDFGRGVALYAGLLDLSDAQRRRICDQGDNRRCMTSEMRPVLDLRTGAIREIISAEHFDGSRPSSDLQRNWLNFAFASPDLGIRIAGLGTDADHRSVVVDTGAARRIHSCPAPTINLPANARVWTAPRAAPMQGLQRRVLGRGNHRLNLFVNAPVAEARGTIVSFGGGPASYPIYDRDPIDLIGQAVGAVVVRPEMSGSANLALDAWSRLRLQGLSALERDISLLETELADESRYPRPLLVAGFSFGVLGARLLVERQNTDVQQLTLVAPMTRYVSPRDILTGTLLGSSGQAPPPAIEAAILRNNAFHRLAFGIDPAAPEASRLARWINSFDPCSLPAHTTIYLATRDDRISWPTNRATHCFSGRVHSFRATHDLLSTNQQFLQQLETDLRHAFQ